MDALYWRLLCLLVVILIKLKLDGTEVLMQEQTARLLPKPKLMVAGKYISFLAIILFLLGSEALGRPAMRSMMEFQLRCYDLVGYRNKFIPYYQSRLLGATNSLFLHHECVEGEP